MSYQAEYRKKIAPIGSYQVCPHRSNLGLALFFARTRRLLKESGGVQEKTTVITVPELDNKKASRIYDGYKIQDDIKRIDSHLAGYGKISMEMLPSGKTVVKYTPPSARISPAQPDTAEQIM